MSREKNIFSAITEIHIYYSDSIEDLSVSCQSSFHRLDRILSPALLMKDSSLQPLALVIPYTDVSMPNWWLVKFFFSFFNFYLMIQILGNCMVWKHILLCSAKNLYYLQGLWFRWVKVPITGSVLFNFQGHFPWCWGDV